MLFKHKNINSLVHYKNNKISLAKRLTNKHSGFDYSSEAAGLKKKY